MVYSKWPKNISIPLENINDYSNYYFFFVVTSFQTLPLDKIYQDLT